jgi:hypothetical protein
MWGCLGTLLILPFTGVFYLMTAIAKQCAKAGGLWRLAGASALLAIGAGLGRLGYFLVFEGFTQTEGLTVTIVTLPVLGWFVIIVGSLVALLTASGALLKSRLEIELDERSEENERRVKELLESLRDNEDRE